MKKRIICIILSSIFIFALSSCTDRETAPPDQPSRTEEKDGVLSQFAEDDGTIWNESWMEETASGYSIGVDIDAVINVPEISRMSTVEVRKYDFSSENKRKLAETVFDGEIYYGDTERMPRSELRKLLDKDRTELQYRKEELQEEMDEPDGEDGSDSYATDLKKRIDELGDEIENYEKMLDKASESYTKLKENDYQGERFVGEREGILFCLDFTGHSIQITPIENESVCPDKIKGSDGDVSYSAVNRKDSTNECGINREEAEECARNFIQKMGFSEMLLKEDKDLEWDVWDASKEENIHEGYIYGWMFCFSVGVDGVAFDSFGVEGADTYFIGEEEYQAEKKYSLDCTMNLYVTDLGVIGATYYNPIEVQTVIPGVKLLPLKDIKEIVKNNLAEFGEFYLDKVGRRQGKIRFTNVELVYYRLSDPNNKDYFTYIPAWRLRRNGSDDQQLYYIVNAMDGSVIRDWESTWTLTNEWLY